MNIHLVLADVVLLLHFAYVAFVVVGLVWIWVGHWRGWSLVRNFYFRLAHLVAIGIVVAEALAGMVCPLTTWENQLRLRAGGGQSYEGSFIQAWVHRVLFFEVGEDFFTPIYVAFFAAVAASLWVVKPRWPWTEKDRANLPLPPLV
jgi:hypothetical protein